ncbi:hypothetical protein MMC21_005438 [Puttea exsequens]|nr:hypothetical protein [Puttea exsequens]
MSPLSPRSINRNTISVEDRRSPFKSPMKRNYIQQDAENVPPSSPNGPPSSPFVANPGSSPTNHANPSHKPSPQKENVEDYQPRRLTEDALRQNDGMTRAERTLEDETVSTTYHTLNDDAISNAGTQAGFAGMDDTAFSAFSAVPNADMTRFARLGQSPTKNGFSSPARTQCEDPTPRPSSRHTPSRDRRQEDDGCSSPTPRRHKSSRDNDTTNLLVDFTSDFTSMSRPQERSPTRNGRHSPHRHNFVSYAASRRTPSPSKHPLPLSTPSEARQLANLLDFDLPPAPTPRSIPSISARELESMKSVFASQISSLKAQLSGKEAEVSSLKNAMDDAERRVGEAQEQVREERGAKEGLQNEKQDWEKREQEMKDVLRSVKEEIVHGDREKDSLLQRVTEAEYKREEAETQALEAESKIAGMQAGSASNLSSENGSTDTSSAVDAAVAKVAKELHGLYKSKHESKVTALKKSYSDRWEKKIKDLQSQIADLSKENEDLRIGRDATMTGVDPAKVLSSTTANPVESEEYKKQREADTQRLKAQTERLKTLEAELTHLQAELLSSTAQTTSLEADLVSSRDQITALTAAAEELMQLSQTAMSSSAADLLPQPAMSSSDSSRNPLSRSTSGSSSGLKAPGFGGGYSGESRIGRIPAYGSGRERTESGTGTGRSGLLGNIERMGRGRGGD